MSRFDDSGEGRDDGKNVDGLWRANVKRALAGKRGQAALRDLRAALEALPEKRLIEGALCTVGLTDRIAAMPATVIREIEPYAHNADGSIKRCASGQPIREPKRPEPVKNWERWSLLEFVADHEGEPEGVCFVGAYVWYLKVQQGLDPAAAFAALPVLPDTDGGEWETARVGEEAGLTSVLALELAYLNDERWGHLTPERRYEAAIAWIDRRLAPKAVPVG